jgi:CheY-like chemotaxis protein
MASPRFVVLVVEDNALIRLDLAASLDALGLTVLEAGSAEEALNLCNSGRQVDVLVTDINLGNGTTGWDVARAFWLREPLPVIYMSGNADNPQRHVPASAFMAKPCPPPEVIATCLRLHAHHRNGGEG